MDYDAKRYLIENGLWSDTPNSISESDKPWVQASSKVRVGEDTYLEIDANDFCTLLKKNLNNKVAPVNLYYKICMPIPIRTKKEAIALITLFSSKS